jgi:hypothetical protein
MNKNIAWMATAKGNTISPTAPVTPLLEGRLKTRINGQEVDREFSLSYKLVNGNWVLEHAGFDGQKKGDAKLNQVLAEIYGKEDFKSAGMLMGGN